MKIEQMEDEELLNFLEFNMQGIGRLGVTKAYNLGLGDNALNTRKEILVRMKGHNG